MKEELKSKETVEDIIKDVCGIKKPKKKRTKRLSKMVETDIDIFESYWPKDKD